MKNMKLVQAVLWGLFLIYYCGSKYFAGYQGYSHAYLFQVGLIVMLTAILPYYMTRLLMTVERLRVAGILLAPSLLSMAGYGAFFIAFIAPNFPDVPAAAVILRGLVPGIVITLILSLPMLASRWQKREPAL